MLGLSFAKKDWATCSSLVPFTLLVFTFLLLIPKTPKKLSFSSCSYFFTKVTYQYLLLLVGFDTLIYRKHYKRSPTVEGHQMLETLKGSANRLVSAIFGESDRLLVIYVFSDFLCHFSNF